MSSQRWALVIAVLVVFSVFSVSCKEQQTSADSSSAKTVVTESKSNPPASLSRIGASVLSGVWANDGGDKVTRDELRSTKGGPGRVTNRVWDGAKVRLFGGKNEVVSFNLVLESTKDLTGIGVSLNALNGPNGASIKSTAASGNGLYNWTSRNIELFYVRYLQIKGLSRLSYELYDERHVPARLRRPHSANGEGRGTWNDRPDHDKYYPDIAVPIELTRVFPIAANQNQSVWVDIYIPKTAAAGTYTGKIILAQEGIQFAEVPVELNVKPFTLPDRPNAKTMVYLGYADIANRYVGEKYPSAGSVNGQTLKRVRDRHFLMAHRHKISLVDSNQGPERLSEDRPRDEWLPRLNGSLFTAANGYAGPGAGVGNGVFSIGNYGSWGWKNEGESGMRLHADRWVNWFQKNSPETEYFLYLIDESSDYPLIERWAGWVKNNPGVGKRLSTLATLPLLKAVAETPSLGIAASWFTVGDTAKWNAAVTSARSATPPKKLFMYNGKRPANGSFATEDDGVALRELAWAHFKKGIDRWYFWESTYYNNYQGGRGETNVFQDAQTFGAAPTVHASNGMTGWNYSNGDGLLFYPGTDRVYSAESYKLEGPIASLRLKHWRRGIQDVDYIALAKAVNPVLTQKIVDRMVPKALWDYGIASQSDPTWVRTDISWSTNPDDWEAVREELANIITSAR